MPGVIAAGNTQTANAAARILERGGNAVDAAVAAAFTSFIAEVGVVHLGGSGFAQIFDPASGRHIVYDFFSNMPGLGRARLPADLNFDRVTVNYGATTQDFYLGRGSVAVPGNIFGLCRLAADFARLSLDVLLQPALELSQNGAVLDPFQAATCELLRPLYTHTPGMRAIFEPNGRMVRAGHVIRIPYLEETLAALAQHGESLLRSGALGRALLDDQQRRGGLLTAADLDNFHVYRQEPIHIPYRDYEILLPPPYSTGGVLTAFVLRLVAHFPCDDLTHGSASHLRLLYESLAATARARVTWEREATRRPWREAVEALLSDDFVQPFVDDVRRALAARRPGLTVREPHGPQSTSHLSVVDGDGMAVSLTTTAGESAGYVVPQTGFIPNNILGEEDLNPNGFHQWQAGTRIATMMTPTIVLHQGKTRLVTGSGGANRIRSAILQVLMNVLDFDMPLPQAVNAPRIHVENGAMQCEYGYDDEVMDRLEEDGYPINRWTTRSIYFGGAHSVAQQPDGTLLAAGDDRRGGATASVA